MLYKNPRVKKVRNSFLMMISCGRCQEELILYQKQGRGNLRRLHIRRVIESNINFYNLDIIKCPTCRTVLGVRNNNYFNMRRSYFHTKELQK